MEYRFRRSTEREEPHQNGLMMNQRQLIPILLALLLALSACGNGEGAQASSKGGGDFEVNSAVLVETIGVERGALAVQGDYAGEFAADRSAEVAFEVTGRITRLDYDIGDRLEDGETLAHIDQMSYRQSVREAQAAVEMAQASVGEAEVAVENLEDDARRKRPLLEKQLISEREIQDLEARLRQARQKVAVAKATLDQNKARLQTARENLKNTEIRAPFDAKIAARHVDLGTHVGPSQPVFRLVSDTGTYLRVNVPERDAGNVAVGKTVGVRVGALGGASIDGKVLRVAPALDPQTRMLRVDVALDADSDQDELISRIRPGMYAQAQIELGDRQGAVIVPRQALLEERGGAPYVWVVEDGEARKQTLLVGLQGRNRVEVLEGLDGGEEIVFRGFDKLREGIEVQSVGGADKAEDRPEPAAESSDGEGG
jgi:membrane fusion protein, multidrug efflux system